MDGLTPQKFKLLEELNQFTI